MRFKKEFKPYKREITNRRIGAAKRALQKQRDKLPLFADQLNQPTPLARIEAFDNENIKQFKKFRSLAAKNWIEARNILRSLPSIEKERFLLSWNASSIPGLAEYFLDALRRFCLNHKMNKRDELQG